MRLHTLLGIFLASIALHLPAVDRPESYGELPDTYAPVRALIAERQWGAAWQALQRLGFESPEVQEQADFHNLSGFVLRHAEPLRLEQALASYRRALAIDPRHVQARSYYGMGLLQMNRPEEARQQLQQIEALCGNRLCEAWTALNAALNPIPGTPQPHSESPYGTR
jgi:tetratricopeptide (TPR) repeat protein